MNSKELIKKYLIASTEYEKDCLVDIIDELKLDIGSMYLYAENGLKTKEKELDKNCQNIKSSINEYIDNYCESNIGEVLLFLTSLPALAKEICAKIEENNNVKGVSTIIAQDNVDKYIRNVFNSSYNHLFGSKEKNKEMVGINLYYQAEKFIDALVFEFKQDISPMIDKNNLHPDDLLYLRRLLINLVNHKENYSFAECEKCTKEECGLYTKCDVLSYKDSHERDIFRMKERIKIIDEIISGKQLTKKEQEMLNRDEQGKMVLKLSNMEENGHKQVEFSGGSKIFSIISAKRFDKILQRRYNNVAYNKDKDIYYILQNGVNSELFKGDELLKNLEDLYNVYNNKENLQ